MSKHVVMLMPDGLHAVEQELLPLACAILVTWLILPVVICLSQRLSHACPRISILQQICEWLIKTVIVSLIVIFTWITVVILQLIHA